VSLFYLMCQLVGMRHLAREKCEVHPPSVFRYGSRLLLRQGVWSRVEV